MTPDHIDALSADAGASMAALEDDGYYTAYCTGAIPIITTDDDPETMDCG